MEIVQFTVGPFAENTYLLIQNGKGVLIDPGFFSNEEFRLLTAKLEEENCELVAILLTHAHVDHVLGLRLVLTRYDVPVYLSHEDLAVWENFELQAKQFGFQNAGFDFTPQELPSDSAITVDGFTFEALYTPGHSPDHISFYFEEHNFLIAGDALFRESIGRTDLYKGDLETLLTSIRNKLYTLPHDTDVYPGHGPATTIGHEIKNNPFTNG